jgi:hypothetical protein
LLGYADVNTTMIYTHVLKLGGGAVRSPLDLLRLGGGGSAKNPLPVAVAPEEEKEENKDDGNEDAVGNGGTREVDLDEYRFGPLRPPPRVEEDHRLAAFGAFPLCYRATPSSTARATSAS